MGRPSKLHFHRGVWESTIAGVTYYFGADERKARAEFHRTLARVLSRETESDRPQTVAGVIARYLTLNSALCVRHWLKLFLEFAGRTDLDDVSRDFLTRYLIYLRQQRVRRPVYDKGSKTWSCKPTDRVFSPRTVKHYVGAVAEALRWAVRNGWLTEMPVMPDLPRAVRKARDVRPDRLRVALDDCPDRAGRPLRFIAYTGCRPSEACRLRWSHVRLDLGICVLDDHKTSATTGKPRTIYLTPEALDLLRGLKADDGFVFVNRYGADYTPAGLRSILRRRGITPYQLRHTFAQSASDAGVPTEVLSRLLGHTDEATAKFYREVRDNRAVDVASRIRLLPSAG